MADASIADTSEVQLEVKRKADGSWHPCQVSLCSSGGLYVKFEGEVSEDLILDTEDVRDCLRVRSVPVQGDDCSSIEEGKHVVAACENNYQRFFYDAVVQKAIRVRHSKRASCRCTFMVKWLFEHTEDKVSCVPSSSIMNLAAKGIDFHPVIAAFLNSTEEKTHLSTPSASPTIDDDSEDEFDFHGLLKHIEGIGSLTDGRRDGQNKLVASEQVNKCVQVSCGRRQLRRSARRQDTAQPTSENPITSAPSSHDNFVQNQSPLSPLAARAVLASLVSKLPKKIESVLQEERKCGSVLGFSSSIYNSRDSGSFIINKEGSLMTSIEGFSDKVNHAQVPNGLPMEVCNKIERTTDSDSSSSSMREESTPPLVVRRFTRSAMNRESANTYEYNGTTSIKDATFARVTRSAAYKGNGNMANKACEKLQDKKIMSTRSICSAVRKEIEDFDVEEKNRSLDERANRSILSSTIRVTRSTANAGTGLAGALDESGKKPLQVKPETESAHVQHSNFGSEAMISTPKRTFPLTNSELRLAESYKKQKALYSVERRQKTTAEELSDNVVTRSQKKSISSDNQITRCSPRLKFSPRT